MSTPEFAQALAQAEQAAASRRSAVMCAEALWWRCHRMLISDALLARGWRVRHIGAAATPEDHRLTRFAVVEGERVIYPPTQTSLPLRNEPDPHAPSPQ
jgi:uncharacterized protein (DUF488 family)